MELPTERILNAANSCIVVTDPNLPDNPLVYVNPAFEHTTGYSFEEVVGYNCRFLQGFDREQPALEGLREALEEGGEGSGIVRNYRKSGEPFYNELSISPVRDGEGRLTHFIGVQQDVSERVEAEEAAKSYSRELSTIFESITDAFFTLDRQWRFIYLNSEAERVLFSKREDLLGKNVWEEFPAAMELSFYTQYHRTMDEGVTVEFEEYYPPLETWFEIKSYPSELGISVYFRDINERKRLEAEREQAEAERRESEERLRSVLVRYASDIITILDAEGRITYQSPVVEGALGYAPEEYIGRSALDLVHPDDVERVSGELAAVMERGGVSSTVEYRLQHAEGGWRYLEGIATNLLDEAGIEGVVVNSRDITERKRAERELAWLASFPELNTSPVIELDLSGHLTYANPAVDALFPELRTSESGHPLLAGYEALVERLEGSEGEAVSDEVWVGELFYQRVVSRVPLEDLVRVYAVDITERKWAEEALQGSEERFKTLAEATFEGIVISEGEEILDVNHNGAAMLGYEPSEIIGKGMPEFLAPDHHELARLKMAASSEEPYEVMSLRKDGTPVEMEIRGRNFHYRGRDVRVTVGRDVSEHKALERRLRHQALHDPLTGLANRTLFMDRLTRALERTERRGELLAVLFLDLDNFKYVNDSLGHSTGDELLVSAARRLSSCLRPSDTVARLGGDEFTILLDGVGGEDEASRIAGRVVSQFRSPVTLDGGEIEREVFTTASAGVVLMASDVESRDSAEELLQRADTALYRAKESGKDHHIFFRQEMQESSVNRLELESKLRRGVEHGEFLLHYQPVVAVESGETCGVEALVRWEHPELGLVSPAEFIPLAEETGLIVGIGRWVLREACRQASLWRRHYSSGHPFSVSVNLSPRQLRQHGLVEDVATILGETGLPPENLELEITESVLIGDEKAGFARVRELKELGVRLALDDFGTGYSSLSYLKHLPIDTLKIDRSFIRDLEEDPGDRAFISAIVSLARSLGIVVVSEGVETSGQLDILREVGAEFAQGYYFAKPVAAEKVWQRGAGV